MQKRTSAIATALGTILLVSGCTNPDDLPLQGERFTLNGTKIVETASDSQVRGFSAPAAQANTAWTQLNSNAAHSAGNLALAQSPNLRFSVNIGKGNTRRTRISADPVAGGGRIFTTDSQALVTAVSSAGETLWSRDLTPDREKNRIGRTITSGGGLALSGQTLFVTTGYGELVALDTTSGAEQWVQKLDAVGGAPTVSGGLVYVAGRDSTGWALNAETGRVQWTLAGTPSGANLVGGPAPAVSDTLAVFPFGSGEVLATFKQGGIRRWSSTVSGERTGRAYARISDISGDPVISGNTVYVGNQGGRLAALDLSSGERKWTAEEGVFSSVWAAGDSVFLVNDLNELIRLDAATGARIWGTKLPFYVKDKDRRRDAIFAHYGPVLAGGLIRVASSDGVLRSFDPATGALVGTAEIPGGAATTPIVAGNTAYVVSAKGQLHAFR